MEELSLYSNFAGGFLHNDGNDFLPNFPKSIEVNFCFIFFT